MFERLIVNWRYLFLDFSGTEIASLSLALSSILNGFRGTTVNAGHALGTVSSPLWATIHQTDISQRTYGFTLSAADTTVLGEILLVIHKQLVKDMVH